MLKAQIIQFPKPKMVLECWECDCQEFILHLAHSTPKKDVVFSVECAECGFEIPFTNQAKEDANV